MLAVVEATAARAEDQSRVRLTETSVTEVGRLTADRSIRLQTRGYGVSYISPSGIGGALTSLATRGNHAGSTVNLSHRYADLSFTLGVWGERILVTGGGGYGISGGGTFNQSGEDLSVRHFSGRSIFLGPGFSIGNGEIYWIHRRNWATYDLGADRHTLGSHHYQLGLGWRF